METGNVIRANNFNSLFLQAIDTIRTNGKWTNPRGFECKELVGALLILTDPNKCLVTIKDRKLNYAYLIIEKFMYLTGKSMPEVLLAYNPNMKNYMNDETGDFDGAYGPRIGNQFEWCYQELKQDRDSRRAIVTIHNDKDCNSETKDSACTLSWHFMIRDGKLDMLVNMRSNDLLWGLCLDVPAFCFAQEVMACWLGIPMGRYLHYDSSLHYYKEFEEKLLGYLKPDEQPEDDYLINNLNAVNDEKNPVWDIPFDQTFEAFNLFWRNEELLRKTGEYLDTPFPVINSYLARLKRFWDAKANH